MTVPSIILLSALGATLLLVLLSVGFGHSEDKPPSKLSRILLISLRLAIGWHFFIEAAEKLHDPNWSSEGYLREATGPLAPKFREIAGDRLVDQVTLQSDGSLPHELDLRWQAYFDAFTGYYGLDDAQTKVAKAALDQSKANAKVWLSTRKRRITLPSDQPGAPPAVENLTMKQRLDRLEQARAEVGRIEKDDLDRYGDDAQSDWRKAKGRVGYWRSGLQRDLEFLNREMKRSLRTVLLGIVLDDMPNTDAKYPKSLTSAITKAAGKRKADLKEGKYVPAADAEWEKVEQQRHQDDQDNLFLYRTALSQIKTDKQYDKLSDQTRKIHQQAIEVPKAPGSTYDLVPYAVRRPFGEWALLDWGDFFVKWGLLVVGLCLLLGLLTRTACVIGALYLVMFYIAMPALPGWPPSPRAEGHYLFINKNIIEALALLALATFRTGRWAGIDGFLAGWRRQPVEQNELRSDAE